MTTVILWAALSSLHPAIAAQPAKPSKATSAGAAVQEVRADDQNARQTQRDLTELFRQYPPSLADVLRLDPSLLSNDAYLAPYPSLAAFLKQHPEVAHNPGYFVGEVRYNQGDNMSYRKISLVQDTMAGFAVLTGFIVLLGGLMFIAKSLIAHNRWTRMAKVQSEVHTKLMDRFTSNDELLAYIQTPVGRRFLESGPIQIEDAPRTLSAPVGRIMWSVQAGLVIGFAGMALILVSDRMAARSLEFADVAQAPFAVGALAIAVGIGFILSAVVSYFLSHRLGLFERSSAPNA
jgi:hypothetical protein